ncbi:MAG TPA: hypothetical protein PLW65_07780 [Pseudomonadota bacterium]|nr:hypothetical protein [Pseudomonadota bacterium]
MRLYPFILFLVAAIMPGCTHFHTNMLAESIKTFSGKMQAAPTDKVWVTSNSDSSCDSGCQSPLTCGGGGGGKVKLGGLFGGGGPSSSDRLAYQVISNYLTQGKKVRVIETHRHNYSTELKPETHKKIDTVIEGKTTATGMSCEDLCMLDEAKKRNADKVLVYHILSMGSNKLTIHYRLSDVKTGAIEASHTISVNHPTSSDTSFIEAP